MNFKELLYRARQGDEDAILEIFEMYRPLLIKNALVDGIFDEDLYQELTAELLKCIRYFRDGCSSFVGSPAPQSTLYCVSSCTIMRFSYYQSTIK